jgi:TetR/AcrR family transcriptional regulator, cholesterol catabolism regulator
VATEIRRADEILELAARLFYERGYPGVSTRALAQAAGIQGASLYHHFSSKEEILYRITQYGSEGFFAELQPILTGPGSFATRLSEFVRAYVRRSQARRYPIAVLFRDGGHLSPEHAEELRLVRRRFQQSVQRFIAQGAAAGEFSVPDPKVAGIAVLDLLKGVDGWARPSGRLDLDAVAATYATLIGQMIGAASSGGSPRSPALVPGD